MELVTYFTLVDPKLVTAALSGFFHVGFGDLLGFIGRLLEALFEAFLERFG